MYGCNHCGEKDKILDGSKVEWKDYTAAKNAAHISAMATVCTWKGRGRRPIYEEV